MGAKKVIPAVIAAVAVAVVGALPVFGQDPCSQTTKLSTTASGVQTWNGTKGATTVGGSGDDAYGVEAWTEAGGNATKLTWFGPNQGGGYAFRAEWTNSTDYLGRFGYFWGSNGKKWNNLGDLCVDYNYTRSANGTGGSYSYLGIYGWTIGSGNSAEYYIVEDWFGNGQQGANNLGNNCQTHGNITVDGKTYQVVTCVRPQGSGCVSCNNQAFGQIFSIRQGMATNSSKCGTISIKKHFEEWSKISAVSKYIYDKTYESKFLVEAAGGTGWFEASYMKFSRTGACGANVPAGNFTLTTSVTGEGTITADPKSASYAPNASVKLTATPKNSSWKFDSWSGGATGTTNPVTITMNANKTVTAKFVLIADDTTNLVQDGKFSGGDGNKLSSDWGWKTGKDWGNSAGDAVVTKGSSTTSGKVKLTITTAGDKKYYPQLIQQGINLEKGTKYRLTFTASAGAARSIDVGLEQSVDPWTGYTTETFSLTTAEKTYTIEFEMKEASDANSQLSFNVGGTGSAGTNVTISNVKLVAIAKFGDPTGIAADRRLAPSSAKPTLRATPSASGVKVSFKATESGTATLRLYSLKGDVLSTVSLQTVDGKSYTHTLNPAAGKLPSGFYMVGLQRNGNTVERMAVLVQ
jgi:hypothetical protein